MKPYNSISRSGIAPMYNITSMNRDAEYYDIINDREKHRYDRVKPQFVKGVDENLTSRDIPYVYHENLAGIRKYKFDRERK